jgi:prevent-host-death family protein
MKVYNTSEARSKFYKLVDSVLNNHHPILIKGKRNNAVMISEEDYRSMEETLYLLSIPGMRDSIVQAKEESIGQCKTILDW